MNALKGSGKRLGDVQAAMRREEFRHLGEARDPLAATQEVGAEADDVEGPSGKVVGALDVIVPVRIPARR